MISEIGFIQYRKLKDIKLRFDKGVNLISGTNGTCKSTLLHIIGNSFQAPKRNDPRYQNPSSINLLRRFVDRVNPKIENLSRGDKRSYSNPAEGTAGILFNVKYTSGDNINFRRHNSTEERQQKNYRFAIKPQYGRNKKDKLPTLPVVYLGISRLFPYGELSDDSLVDITRDRLPDSIHEAFKRQFADLTRIEIVQAVNQVIDGVKRRSDFSTTRDGIDSNTISSGEDNISIVLRALNCLRYISESVVPGQEREVESVLLIDEFDATLHPSAQKKLFDIIDEYSEKYKIQVFLTTHSLFILKYAYERKKKINYLVDQLDHVGLMEDPGPLQIEMHLREILRGALYKGVFIPVYTEDEEARVFLGLLFDYICQKIDDGFAKAKELLHLVDVNIGAQSLRNLFHDTKMSQSTMRAICILDGDQNAELKNHIITLPGSSAPERLFSDYLRTLISENRYREFWDAVLEHGYSKAKASDILKEFDQIDDELNRMRASEESTHGQRRELNKKHFNKYREFYELVIRAWLVDDKNRSEIDKFRRQLYQVFQKTARLYAIDGRVWPRFEVDI